VSTGSSSVNVVATVVASSTGVEVSAAVVGQITVGVDCEASGGRGTNITLELSSRRSQDTATAISIGEATVADAVGPLSVGESRSLSNSVLAVTELTNNSGLTASGSQGEAALIASGQGSSRGAKGEAQCCVYVLHLEYRSSERKR